MSRRFVAALEGYADRHGIEVVQFRPAERQGRRDGRPIEALRVRRRGGVHRQGARDAPRQLMSFLGLVPAERSTGERARRLGLTLVGNRRARRVLVEAA